MTRSGRHVRTFPSKGLQQIKQSGSARAVPFEPVRTTRLNIKLTDPRKNAVNQIVVAVQNHSTTTWRRPRRGVA